MPRHVRLLMIAEFIVYPRSTWKIREGWWTEFKRGTW